MEEIECSETSAYKVECDWSREKLEYLYRSRFLYKYSSFSL